MLKDIKRALKLMKYGIQFKQMMVFSIISFVIGIAFIVFGKAMQTLLGILYLALCMNFFVQTFTSVLIASSVSSSGSRKALFGYVPVTLNGIGAIVGYIVGLVAIIVKYYVLGFNAGTNESGMAGLILLSTLLVMVIQIYVTVCYKAMIVSMIVFFAIFFPVYAILQSFMVKIENLGLSFGAAAGIGFAMIALGIGGSFILSKLMYKKPLDSWYYKRTIASAMK